jgi:hypothetical protein
MFLRPSWIAAALADSGSWAQSRHPSQVVIAPGPERFEHWSQRSAVRGESVPDTERLDANRPGHQTGGFHLSQLLTQDLRCHTRERATKLSEAVGATFDEATADHWLPSAFDRLNGRVNGTSRALFVTRASSSHNGRVLQST